MVEPALIAIQSEQGSQFGFQLRAPAPPTFVSTKTLDTFELCHMNSRNSAKASSTLTTESQYPHGKRGISIWWLQGWIWVWERVLFQRLWGRTGGRTPRGPCCHIDKGKEILLPKSDNIDDGTDQYHDDDGSDHHSNKDVGIGQYYDDEDGGTCQHNSDDNNGLYDDHDSGDYIGKFLFLLLNKIPANSRLFIRW